MVVNLACGDSVVQNFTIENIGGSGSVLNVTGGIIGGGGIYDSSYVVYTVDGALTTHNFVANGAGVDTLFVMVYVQNETQLAHSGVQQE